MELYVYLLKRQVAWEQMKVGQPALVVPNSDNWSLKKKKKKDAWCEMIISVMPQENCYMKTISPFLQVWLTLYLMFKPRGLRATGDSAN